MGEGWRFCGMTRGTTLALAANALRNIPQGMSTGLAFLAACSGEKSQVMAAAVVLSLGLGIQNFLEGSAVAMPIRKDGVPAKTAFCISVGAGILEPAFGVGIAAFGDRAGAMMPWLLSFAAGAMIYVIAEELIPKASGGENDRSGTFGVMGGFLLMMVLDVAFG
ncbi:MAG TPA: ZIP family metal transporter [Candidatus Eisenbergiella pullicola]|nr:ZIP family metal transporter [Candidatus Eisenbergiella pullicola]